MAFALDIKVVFPISASTKDTISKIEFPAEPGNLRLFDQSKTLLTKKDSVMFVVIRFIKFKCICYRVK